MDRTAQQILEDARRLPQATLIGSFRIFSAMRMVVLKRSASLNGKSKLASPNPVMTSGSVPVWKKRLRTLLATFRTRKSLKRLGISCEPRGRQRG